MAKYRKKNVEIEAWRLEPTAFWPGWLSQALLRSEVRSADRQVAAGRAGLIISTLEGEMRANPGDWIIQGVKGELYPVKPDIFAETYEAVD